MWCAQKHSHKKEFIHFEDKQTKNTFWGKTKTADSCSSETKKENLVVVVFMPRNETVPGFCQAEVHLPLLAHNVCFSLHLVVAIAHFSVVSLLRHLRGWCCSCLNTGSAGRMSSSSSPSSWWMSSRMCIRAYLLVLSQLVLITSAVKRRKNSRAVVNCPVVLRSAAQRCAPNGPLGAN